MSAEDEFVKANLDLLQRMQIEGMDYEDYARWSMKIKGVKDQYDQARKDEIAQIRAANCKRSQDVLANLSSSGRIRVKGPDGQEVKMPEEERQTRIAEAQQGVITNCNVEPQAPSEPSVANAGG